MLRPLSILALCLLTAGPALAAERVRLVAGGLDLGQIEPPRRAAIGPRLTGGGGMAPGGFIAYSFDNFLLSSSVRGEDGNLSADLSAAYASSIAGIDGVAALTLGYDWSGPAAFSLNPSHAALAGVDGYRPDLSLSLSWSHEVTPSLSLSGFAAATRSHDDLSPDYESDFRLGAGLGYRF